MKKIEGVKDVHDLHVWCIASGMYALSCHTRINDHRPSCSSPILQSLNSMLSEKYHIDHATIQFECNDHSTACCEMDGLYCRMENAQEKSNGHSHKHETLLSKHNP